jgi:AcrR family transcriptional regulator
MRLLARAFRYRMYLKCAGMHFYAKIRGMKRGPKTVEMRISRGAGGRAGKERQRSRVSRKESQAQTRARLIAVGREHFLRDGLSGATAEQIAEEAGFSRGALYANFLGKEELFLAVIQASVDAELEHVQRILHSRASARERLRQLRESFGDLAVNQEWVLLEAEMQTHALREASIREAFRAHVQQRVAVAAGLLREVATELGLELRATPDEIAMVMGSLMQGLAVRQAVLQGDAEAMRGLAMGCFDLFLGGDVG